MKKFVSKIRNKRLKGNVSLLIIFILLASSVIALLSINQIQRLLTYWNMTFNYFRAFYLAKAGTELWLTEVYNSWDGFNDEILSGSSIVQDNLVWIYSGFNPHFNMTITWDFKYLTDDIRDSDSCSGYNKIKLAPWAGIMLSLFSDDTKGLDKILSDDANDKNLTKLSDINKLSLYWYSSTSELTFAFFTYNKNSYWEEYMEDIVVEKWWTLSSFLSKSNVQSLIGSTLKEYLTIKNSWNQPVEFCVKMDGKYIPYSDSLITVRGNYADMEVGLQSVVKKWVPDWTLNVLDEISSSS